MRGLLVYRLVTRQGADCSKTHARRFSRSGCNGRRWCTSACFQRPALARGLVHDLLDLAREREIACGDAARRMRDRRTRARFPAQLQLGMMQAASARCPTTPATISVAFQPPVRSSRASTPPRGASAAARRKAGEISSSRSRGFLHRSVLSRCLGQLPAAYAGDQAETRSFPSSSAAASPAAGRHAHLFAIEMRRRRISP